MNICGQRVGWKLDENSGMNTFIFRQNSPVDNVYRAIRKNKVTQKPLCILECLKNVFFFKEILDERIMKHLRQALIKNRDKLQQTWQSWDMRQQYRLKPIFAE